MKAKDQEKLQTALRGVIAQEFFRPHIRKYVLDTFVEIHNTGSLDEGDLSDEKLKHLKLCADEFLITLQEKLGV